MTESPWVRIGLRVATILVLGFLYLPLWAMRRPGLTSRARVCSTNARQRR